MVACAALYKDFYAAKELVLFNFAGRDLDRPELNTLRALNSRFELVAVEIVAVGDGPADDHSFTIRCLGAEYVRGIWMSKLVRTDVENTSRD